MMSITASAKNNDKGYKAILEAVAFLKGREVLIGIPENTARRNDENGTPVNNAELLFIHTNGSPIRGIPPRPVLEPAITKNKESVSHELKKAIDAAVNGNKEAILPALGEAGMYGQNIAREFFTDSANEWKPNAESTIRNKSTKVLRVVRGEDGKPVKGKDGKSRKRYVITKRSDRPLIDTGEMRKSITYVVREARK